MLIYSRVCSSAHMASRVGRREQGIVVRSHASAAPIISSPEADRADRTRASCQRKNSVIYDRWNKVAPKHFLLSHEKLEWEPFIPLLFRGDYLGETWGPQPTGGGAPASWPGNMRRVPASSQTGELLPNTLKLWAWARRRLNDISYSL